MFCEFCQKRVETKGRVDYVNTSLSFVRTLFLFMKPWFLSIKKITTAQNYVNEIKEKGKRGVNGIGDREHLLELVSFQTMWASLSVNWSPVGRFPAIQLTTFWKSSFTLYSLSEFYLSNLVLLTVNILAILCCFQENSCMWLNFSMTVVFR